MIPIQKGSAPPELLALQREATRKGLSPNEAYDTLKSPLKDSVRTQLLEEQGNLCAYCMCSIPRGDVPEGTAPIIIEHVISRNPEDKRDVGQGLDYNNFVVVCHGNRGKRKQRKLPDLTCDAHRGNREFRKINPMDRSTLSTIFYQLDGRIDASDPDVQFDLLDTLNLNCATAPLVSERKSALDALIADMQNVPIQELSAYCNSRLHSFSAETGRKTPYVGILIWYLQSLIKQLGP